MPSAESLRFRDALEDDVPHIAALLNTTAGALTARFGDGHWSGVTTERGVAFAFRHARIRVGCIGRRIITTLRLAKKKPWAIDVAYFTPVARPLYLTGMAVAVASQRQGWGRLALADACLTARNWPTNAIRLDAYDAEAGAGGFYAACGFEARGGKDYKSVPLLYFELLL